METSPCVSELAEVGEHLDFAAAGSCSFSETNGICPRATIQPIFFPSMRCFCAYNLYILKVPLGKNVAGVLFFFFSSSHCPLIIAYVLIHRVGMTGF